MSTAHSLVDGEKPAVARTPTADVAPEKEIIKNTTTDSEDIQDEPTEANEYPSGLRLVFILLALVLGIFLVSLDLTIVATAIPKITSEFNGLDDVSWYSAAFFMTIGGFQSAWGKAYKYFPLKTTFLLAIFTFELGSLICGIAPNSTTLIVGRAISGLGAGGIGSGAYTIIAFSAKPKTRPMFTGIIGASYGIAAVVGPLLGGVFAAKVSWRWCFYVNLPIGGFSALIIVLFFKTPTTAKPKAASLGERLLQMDLVGAILVMGAVVSYILALHYGGAIYKWKSSQVVGLLVGFVVLSVAFAAWEWCQVDRAMVPFRLIRNRVYLVPSLFAFFFSGAYFLVIYYLPIYFQGIDDVSAAMSGVRNLPLILAVSLSMLASGAYITITGISAPLTVAGTALAMSCVGLLYTLEVDSTSGKWIGCQVIGGVGWGVASQIPIITVQATAPAADLAEVTAIVLFLQTIGGAFMVSAAQAAFVNVLVKVIPSSAPGVNPAMVVSTGATNLRTVFSADELTGVLVAYMRGLQAVFAIGIASIGIAFVIILFQSWKRLNTAAILGGGAAA
ncbi:MFS general substrate transporter [Clathrospora elynae]|uniref:MFS general substrate transporter n=1 Tax=Clathrospora elynae TaxID=706981 RepID=A0A6A5SDD8_9PLEO|nr:MFS general substrate transporter [Clathrospora elynae]